MQNEIKAVIFDHDDTLVESRKPKWDQHKHVAKTHYNRELTDEFIGLHYGKPFAEFVKILYDTDDSDQAFEYIALYRKEFPKVIYPETLSTLRALKDMGMLTGVVTATTREGLTYDHKTMGITADLIDYTQTADESDFHKPDPRVFDSAKNWLSERGVKPQEVVYVGDALHDMRAAVDAGFNFVGVETGMVTGEVFLQNGVKSVAGVANIIDLLKTNR